MHNIFVIILTFMHDGTQKDSFLIFNYTHSLRKLDTAQLHVTAGIPLTITTATPKLNYDIPDCALALINTVCSEFSAIEEIPRG